MIHSWHVAKRSLKPPICVQGPHPQPPLPARPTVQRPVSALPTTTLLLLDKALGPVTDPLGLASARVSDRGGERYRLSYPSSSWGCEIL